MKPKSVLVVEDRHALRGLLRGGLEKRGFRVATAEDEMTAREKSKGLGEDLDVVLIDVELGRGGNGLEFGLWLKEEWRRQGRRLPEFLVFSAHEKPDYYQAAIYLGAATYLRKGELGGDPDDPIPASEKPVRIDRITHHVRALALRRALQGDSLEIARKSKSLYGALELFCSDLLSPELEVTLAGNFILLLGGDRGRVSHFAGSHLEVAPSKLLERIQTAAHGRRGEVAPLVFERKDISWVRDLPAEEHEQASRLSLQLDGAAFIALSEAREYRLTLGIVPDAHRGGESVVELARILGQCLSPTVAAHFLALNEARTTLEVERSMISFRFTSEFCLYQGQELAALIHEAEEEGDRLGGRAPLEKLHAVAEELRSAGEILKSVELRSEEEPESLFTRIEMAEILKQRWDASLANHLRLPVTALQIVGSCVALVPRAKVETAISQILYWLGRRLTRFPRNDKEPQVIRCVLEEMEETACIVFEEHLSRRMPKRLRSSLFAPFTPLPAPPGEELDEEILKGRRLGLFLAKIVVETVGGTLEEDSDAIPGDFGHRFVLQLPAARCA